VIVVVASNNRGGTELGWPASANGVVAVESADANGQLNDTAVTSPLLSVVGPGEKIRALSWAAGRWDSYVLQSGSSAATAWTSGVLALIWSAHPTASANQIIQTLLRSTGTGKGQLVRNDSWGYGFVSVNTMLAADPTTYPDVNPLLRKDADAQPAYAAVVGPATPAAPSPGAKSGTAGGLPVLLIVGAGLVALVVLAAIVLAVVLTRRNRTRTPPPTPQYQQYPSVR
jgi:subtilisin family serine protease